MKSLLTGLADIIFPPRCLTCDTILDHHGKFPVCPTCSSRIKFIKSPLCTCCGIPYYGADISNHLCGDCSISKPAFIAARAVCHYETTVLEAIHNFKYKGEIASGKILGRLMASYDYPDIDIRNFSLVMPVPLHSKRLRERGFNQAVILAREIAGMFTIPLDFLTIKRYIHTEPQIHLGKKERASNVRGAFNVTKQDRVRKQKIVLVDDVYTTGSTVKECCRVLMENNAEEVAVLTLARAV